MNERIFDFRFAICDWGRPPTGSRRFTDSGLDSTALSLTPRFSPCRYPHFFKDPLNESDSRDGRSRPKPRSGWPVYRLVPAPAPLVFCFSAARSTTLNSLVRHIRAAEKQKNRIEGDTAQPINTPAGFSPAGREQNLCGFAGNVGNDKRFSGVWESHRSQNRFIQWLGFVGRASPPRSSGMLMGRIALARLLNRTSQI